MSAAAGTERADSAMLRRLLRMICRQLDMDIAYLTSVDRGSANAPMKAPTRTILMAVTRDGVELVNAVGKTQPLKDTWCAQVVREGLALVPDVADAPELAPLEDTGAYSIASHAGVVVTDGKATIGTLCVLGHRPAKSLGEHAASLLSDAAEVIAPWLAQLVSAGAVGGEEELAPHPAPLVDGQPVESLTRPLLEALQQLTRLGTTYLTRVYEEEDEQHIVFARNARTDFLIPEGLVVPWEDTLCKRALDEGRPCTQNVPEVWGDSQAARDLGIQVYVSVPITRSDGSLWGTLCAADSRPAEDVDDHLPTLRMFGDLIAAEIERTESLLAAASDSARELQTARTDALTGCTSRQLVEPWLTSALAALGPAQCLVVTFIDVNDFKTINDTYGHAAGDAVLRDVASHLLRNARPDDLVARYGGDEFLLAAVLPVDRLTAYLARTSGLHAVGASFDGGTHDVRLAIGSAHTTGAAAADTDAALLIHEADRSMYRHKLAAKQAAGSDSADRG